MVLKRELREVMPTCFLRNKKCYLENVTLCSQRQSPPSELLWDVLLYSGFSSLATMQLRRSFVLLWCFGVDSLFGMVSATMS